MSGPRDRLSRLLALVPYLRTHPDIPLAELAEAFDVDVRQIRADLELLWVCGLPGGGPGDLIDLTFEGDRVTLLDPQTLDRPLRLTADEALALSVAARALADVPGLEERDALERAVAKLATATGTDLDEPGRADVTLQVAVEPVDASLQLLRRAAEQRRRLHLRYLVESRDEITERDVDPLRVQIAAGRWYLEGWCRRAEAMRLFRLDRIVSAELLDAPAELPAEAVPRDLAEGLFRPAPTDLSITLELAAAARWVADYYPVEQARETTDGRLLVELRTPDPEWVVRLALRLGGAGRVVAPESVAAEVARRATAALNALASADAPNGAPTTSPNVLCGAASSLPKEDVSPRMGAVGQREEKPG